MNPRTQRTESANNDSLVILRDGVGTEMKPFTKIFAFNSRQASHDQAVRANPAAGQSAADVNVNKPDDPPQNLNSSFSHGIRAFKLPMR